MTIRSLRLGMSGSDVKAVQDALNAQPGAKQLNAKGVFDAATEARVREFQRAKGLDPDGVVGKDTRRALFPLGLATATIVGVRSQGSSSVPSGPPPIVDGLAGRPLPRYLRPSTDFDDTDRRPSPPAASQDVAPVKVPGVRQNLFARIMPEHFLDFDYDHIELVPGAQVTLPQYKSFSPRQDAFSLTLQSIYQRGPDDGHNQTITFGEQIVGPVSRFGGVPGPWTLTSFVQATDVDYFWASGRWHFIQPYAQLGFQVNLAKSLHPTLTAALMPVNIGFDVTKNLSAQFAAGTVASWDLATNSLTAGWQASVGFAIKFGRPK